MTAREVWVDEAVFDVVLCRDKANPLGVNSTRLLSRSYHLGSLGIIIDV